ncbi:nuclear transport factor 2 family protein [Croceicoccus sp. BE223]|uniref:nuclear transport factor 2 family protein n=1 Tax=Croceicoccus sp. BE223 TaxID=2817716 RepID=UPI00285DE564|nr:nuclear transport factor 2 family protein [Croceicoccus sp. BE223]MDR7101101.1 uncharacterized protein (TIGR02246 family) [Croceicoccus sp. BE223]
MADVTSLESRLDRIESRFAIEDLCMRYCIACDDRDTALLAGCFTPDVSIVASNGSMNAQGRDAVMAMYDQLFRVRGPGFHWSHDRTITIDRENPDRATGHILAHAETCPAGRVSIAGIRYSDRYERHDGTWYFASRVLDFVYYMPLRDYLDRFPKRERVLTPDGWAEADFPEGAASWSQWHEAESG